MLALFGKFHTVMTACASDSQHPACFMAIAYCTLSEKFSLALQFFFFSHFTFSWEIPTLYPSLHSQMSSIERPIVFLVSNIELCSYGVFHLNIFVDSCILHSFFWYVYSANISDLALLLLSLHFLQHMLLLVKSFSYL